MNLMINDITEDLDTTWRACRRRSALFVLTMAILMIIGNSLLEGVAPHC